MRAGATAFLGRITGSPPLAPPTVDMAPAKAPVKRESMMLVYEKRQEDLSDFCAHYECLVESLCTAAQKGIVERLESEYFAERDWILTHYFLVRHYLAAFLPKDAVEVGAPDNEPQDAFQGLCASPDILTQLETDDGNMISRIVRTREALAAYGEHLAGLIDSEKSCS